LNTGERALLLQFRYALLAVLSLEKLRKHLIRIPTWPTSCWMTSLRLPYKKLR